MRERFRKQLVFFALMGTILWITTACLGTDSTVELEKNLEKQFYIINPKTILDSLAQGNTDVFSLLPGTPGPGSLTSTNVQWTQEEYFQIAQALHERSWGEPLGDQNLFSVAFDVNCSDIEGGIFTKASFDSAKVVQSGEETRIEHWITIRPANNLISTVKVEYQPSARIKKPIDLEGYRITADEALQIAERNGGSETRLAVDNDCEITAFAPTVNGGGWEISYVNYTDNFVHSLFGIAVDPQTGKYKVLYPKPK